jgi:LysM repeat protein
MIMPNPSPLLKKVRLLSQALLISGALNIGVLVLLSYWIVRERPPTPYFELKPATYDQQQIPLADQRSCGEAINALRALSFDQLIAKLEHSQLIENGYTERDLALSCLVAFYHFDLSRALSKESYPQQRILKWKNILTGESFPLVIYSGLTEQEFKSIIAFAKTERWPMTPDGLFLILQKQKANLNIDSSLVETFMLTPEFLTVELLFNRAEVTIRKQKLLEIVLEGDWPLLRQFVDQQRQLNDLSTARRQKFLLDYIKKGSETAAYLLLKVYQEFVVKKLDDAQVIAILQLLPHKTKESEYFALAMLTSPRSTSVWQQASLRLYEYAGEPIPTDWNYKTSLQRFAPNQTVADVLPPKTNLNLVVSVDEPPAPIKPSTSLLTPIMNKPISQNKPVSAPSTPIAASKPTTPSPAPIPKAPAKMTIPASSNPSSSKKAISPNNSVPPPCRLYIVQEGDSLWKISRRFGVDMEVLKERNRLHSNSIKPGTVLKIP